MKIVVYACTNLAYDQIFSPVTPTTGAEMVFFIDRRPRFVRHWAFRDLPPQTDGLSDAMTNRYVKFFPHKLFGAADISVYVDANTLILADLAPLVAEFQASGAGIGLFPHRQRFGIAEEIEFGLKVGKIPASDADKAHAQIAFYHAEGLPEDCDFTENAIIFRNHRDPDMAGAMDLWWEQMETYTRRDQLSLPYVLHKTGLKTHVWDWNYKFENPYFHRYLHRQHSIQDVNVYLKNRSLASRWEAALYTPLLRAYHRVTGKPQTFRLPQPDKE